MDATTIIALLTAGLAILSAVVMVVLFAGRLSTSIDHLARAVSRFTDRLDSHETRISHVEGRLGRRAGDHA
jgi:Sec-independent protein translocase protein TatA